MIDKKRKIWFIIMGLIVLVSILAALLSIRGEKSQNSAVNKVNINTNNQTVNVVNSVTVGNSVYKNEQTKPDVSNLKDDVKQKIENYLNNYYKQLWEELADQYSEEDITEMLKQQENAELGDVGFKQSFEQVFINDKVVSYTYYMVGNLRGTPWEKVYGITFDVNTGNPIKIEDIVTSKQK